ncbi:MAG: D-alanyl-D-alanine carboxypeptidase family protein [Pseudomonadota bacterium]
MVGQAFRASLLALGFFISMVATVQAAPYAALVLDARTGEVLHAENADTRLHPASLTKMMTLYLAFTEIKAGRMRVDQKITISNYAASKPPSKLGLRAGQTIEFRYLIRAAAVKSANDAAAAIAEAISGSEPAFARRMTEVARAMGMSRTTFRNASGLTQKGHLSTARDMAILGRQLFFDFPEYYNLFSRRSTDAKLKVVYNTNRRLLAAYEGADGIKTGYTRAAGYNLVSSARRGSERVIVSLFGGRSVATRNARVAELMDLGFKEMPSRAQIVRPSRLLIAAPSSGYAVASARAPARSTRPVARPQLLFTPAEREIVIASIQKIDTSASGKTVVADQAQSMGAPRSLPTGARAQQLEDLALALDRAAEEAAIVPDRTPADFAIIPPRPRPENLPVAKTIRLAASKPAGDFGVELGGSWSRPDAERLLLRTALQELEALEGSQRRLMPSGGGRYRAQFVGLTRTEAETACARLSARQTECSVMSVGG